MLCRKLKQMKKSTGNGQYRFMLCCNNTCVIPPLQSYIMLNDLWLCIICHILPSVEFLNCFVFWEKCTESPMFCSPCLTVLCFLSNFSIMCLYLSVSFVCSFVIAGRSPAYSGPQRWDLVLVQCAWQERGRELVGVCGVCVRHVGWRRAWVRLNSL